VKRNRLAAKQGVQRRKEANVEAYRAYMRQKTKEWRARNPGRCAPQSPQSRRASKLRCKFGITVETYERMFAAQGGLCAICQRKCSSGRRLAVDHCHRTKAVRGLLCKACNTAIGFLEDSTERLDRAKAYLALGGHREAISAGGVHLVLE